MRWLNHASKPRLRNAVEKVETTTVGITAISAKRRTSRACSFAPVWPRRRLSHSMNSRRITMAASASVIATSVVSRYVVTRSARTWEFQLWNRAKQVARAQALPSAIRTAARRRSMLAAAMRARTLRGSPGLVAFALPSAEIEFTGSFLSLSAPARLQVELSELLAQGVAI